MKLLELTGHISNLEKLAQFLRTEIVKRIGIVNGLLKERKDLFIRGFARGDKEVLEISKRIEETCNESAALNSYRKSLLALIDTDIQWPGK